MEETKLDNQILSVAKELLEKVGFEAEVKLVENSFEVGALPVVSIESEKDLSILIGKNGQNLNALEHIIRLIAFRRVGGPEQKIPNFAVDINDYRKSRSRYILDLAKSAASRVINTQRAEALAPMSSYERRLVHTELASYKEVLTESIGEEPRRRIVIKPLVI
ncbi:MAG: R3H domain-containing nucleic acid-binding protein [Minisyncoccia bacterium]